METFKVIEQYPDSFTASNSIARIADGLGFRYYWGTEGLSESDLSFSTGNEGRTIYETLDHILYMTTFISNSLEGEQTTFPEPKSGLSFSELREETLNKLSHIRTLLANVKDEDLGSTNLKIEAQGNSFEMPFWNLLNGPLIDLAHHVGQITMMRRSNGNPINPKINPFFCKMMD